jgi:hypothetical protein
LAYQPPVLSSQNKSATSNQPTVLFCQKKSAPVISHQPNERADRKQSQILAHWTVLQLSAQALSDFATQVSAGAAIPEQSTVQIHWHL